ncbi:glycoside hydrolase family 97 catalytic domain-containing protein [Halomicroarcula sp. F13]|uniref:Glycoside hydrolase family 97 catalytic domain-containing protein n=1 Tax=Haloarcula rubra TaxID=2487747 RepID=A0AAW4PMA7_9EURY|nr:glycoside hydrolase family 97 catalytic domain-containing protein [Halomicroarcula rubra]MBX0321537.1 glycoside hydrolase family 97 catalytic domain-containing protein [Halomicroarcula rubra]
MVSRQSQQSLNKLGRREFLGGVASLVAAAAYTQDVPASAAAQVTGGDDSDRQTVTSPDGSIDVRVDVSGGTPTYSVAFDGTTYVEPSALGFDFQNQATFGVSDDGSSGAGITVTGSERGTETESWTPEWDQYDSVTAEYSYLRLGLEETAGPGRSANLELRVFDDGLGFRVVFDDSFAANSDKLVVASENTQYNFADDYTAWWIRNEFTNPRFEQEYRESSLSDVDAGTRSIQPNGNTVRTGAHTPFTIKAGDDAYMSVHEADLDDYSTASIVPATDSGGTAFTTQLAPLPDNTKASLSAPNATPWRTIQFGRSPGDLVESSLIPLLNEDRNDEVLPSDGSGGVDTSWLTPRTYIGIWWTMIAGNANWEYKTDAEISNSGNDPAGYIHGARTERMKRYMHFASQNGIDSVLVEGWNEGWDTYPGDGSGLEMGVDDSYPDFDVPEVTDYGANLSSSVEMTIHNETAGNIPNYEDEILDDDVFDGYESAGIRSIKNGYVSDPGLGFEGDGTTATHNQHCQLAVNHHRTVIREAAGERQLLEIHEGIKPTGERRTYPNVAAREVVKAQEYDGFGALGSSVGREHHVTLPYTRMLAGPTSFQPGIFDITFNDDTGGQIQTTRAKQLAMYPTYNAGIQMAADRIEAYIDDELGVGEFVQAAAGTLSEGTITADDWRDAFGTNYVPLDPNREPSGASVSFTVTDVPAAGTYTLHLRYASDGEENAGRVVDNGNPQFTLGVNGTTQTVEPSFTEYWDDWQVHAVDVDLDEGDNTVSLGIEYSVDSEGNFESGDVGGLNVNTVGVTERGASAPFPAEYTDLDESHVANENVAAEPEFAFVEDVPAGGWDDTVAVAGEIGDYSVTARREGETWYLGAMSDDGGRAVDVPLDFLNEGTANGRSNSNGKDPQGRKYVAEIYSDGARADVDADPTYVRIDEAVVDPSTTFLASMARGGGTAVKLRPAKGREINRLTEYERPEQDLTFAIEDSASLDDQFITAMGSNDSEFVGGRTVEILVDGDVVSTENVRLEPGATDETFHFGYTISSRGTYDVALRDPDDGDILAEQTVEIRPGELVASFTDPSGDDYGPGGYVYPTNGAFQAGAFDLRSFSVYEDDSAYLFSFEVGNLYDAFGGDFSPHYFVLYLSDPSREGGRTTELGDLNVTANFGSEWDYRVAASGFGGGVVDATGTQTGSPRKLVDFDRNSVILSVDKSALGGIDISSVSVAPVVGSEDYGAFRDVQEEVGGYTFGGAKSGAVDNATSIIDCLTPEGVDQSEALDYDSETLATVPFTPLQ